jgi:hypothetical protein
MDYAEISGLAARFGLRFDPGQNYSLADDYSFLHFLALGENRYAFNVLSGRFRQSEVLAFDYHYDTSANDTDNDLAGAHHYLTTAMALVPAYFSELRIVPEGLLSKIVEAMRREDIEFESAEFSRAFRVWSRDKRFAYDFCNPEVIEYLLENRDLNLHIQNCTLALVPDTQWSAQQVEYNLERLNEIRSRLPEYLFTKA